MPPWTAHPGFWPAKEQQQTAHMSGHPTHPRHGDDEPLITVTDGEHRITVLGTAHISQASADKVRALLETGEYDAVAIELCPSRHNAIVNPDALAKMNLFEVVRRGKAAMVAANLALGAYQQRMAEQLGIVPGAEMRTAIECARADHLPVLLIDREIAVTLKRIYRNVPWWKRFHLVAGLLASVVTRRRISEEEIERLKEGDILESTFSQFAEEAEELYIPLIDERDRYMSARLLDALDRDRYRNVLAIVGAGHLRGMRTYLEEYRANPPAPFTKIIEELDRVPPASRWPKILPWLIVALIVTGFVIGFSRSPGLGWQMVLDWVLINGGLAALGAVIATAHPMTVVGAFAAAPLTSLNPMIGAGMVTAAIELYLRKPSVGDFTRLRNDTTHIRGWWRNRVARTLLVFLLSTLGSAAGTYIAGILIFDRLMNA